jgi:hypothetical protein
MAAVYEAFHPHIHVFPAPTDFHDEDVCKF